MFRQIVTLIIAFTLFSTSAMASTHEGLKAAFDEFNFAVTVEWDQKDPLFLEAQKFELTQQIASLESQGLTREELIGFVKSKIKDASVIKTLDSVLEAVSLNKMTTEEAQDLMIKSLNKTHATGANWNGAIVITPVALLVLILIVVLVVD